MVDPISSNAVFHVSDLEKSLKFYTENLGFKVDFKFGDPATYAGMSLGKLYLHLSSSYPYKNNTGHGHIYIIFNEVDEIFSNLEKAGVEFFSKIDDRDYGMRDFAVKDPDGNQIGIGCETS
ncbi:MAG: glyoxalase superfamily protein [Nitrospirales bacterium]